MQMQIDPCRVTSRVLLYDPLAQRMPLEERKLSPALMHASTISWHVRHGTGADRVADPLPDPLQAGSLLVKVIHSCMTLHERIILGKQAHVAAFLSLKI